jgi:hypothetical protein
MASQLCAELQADPLESWLWRVEQAIGQAPACIVGRIVTDRDAPVGPVRKGPGRLLGVQATAEACCHLPALPGGLRCRARGDSFWIEGPGRTQSEPLEALLEEILDPEVLRLIALPELVALDPAFLDERAWLDLDKRYVLGPIDCHLDGRGLHVRIRVELEAC